MEHLATRGDAGRLGDALKEMAVQPMQVEEIGRWDSAGTARVERRPVSGCPAVRCRRVSSSAVQAVRRPASRAGALWRWS